MSSKGLRSISEWGATGPTHLDQGHDWAHLVPREFAAAFPGRQQLQVLVLGYILSKVLCCRHFHLSSLFPPALPLTPALLPATSVLPLHKISLSATKRSLQACNLNCNLVLSKGLAAHFQASSTIFHALRLESSKVFDLVADRIWLSGSDNGEKPRRGTVAQL